MANVLLTPRTLGQEVLSHLENDLVVANMVNTDYSKEFVSVGDTIDVERPQRFVGQSNNLDVTGYNEDLIGGKFPLQIDTTETVKFQIDPLDLTLSVMDNKIQQKYIMPAVTKLKDRVEQELGQSYKSFWNFSGTPGTPPATFLSLATNGTILTNGAIPMSDRLAFHNPNASLSLANSLTGVFVQGMAKTALEQATMGKYGGFMNFESVHMPIHTVGDHGGTPLVAGAAQGVTYEASRDTNSQTLNTDGWTNSTTGLLLEGDVITLAGVYSVNPITRQSTGRLQDFVLNADANSDGAGLSALNISPAIITSGAFQTVTVAPVDNAVITVKTGAANSQNAQSILMHKDAMTLVTRALKIPKTLKSHTVSGNRMTISVTEDGNFDNLQNQWRLDMLFKVDSLLREYGSRLTS